MYDRTVVVETSERALALLVPPAPGDPFAAVSLYWVHDGRAAARAGTLELARRLAWSDFDVETTATRRTVTLTASCRSSDLSALLAQLAAAMDAAGRAGSDGAESGAPRGPDPAPRPGPAERLREALVEDEAADTPAVDPLDDGPGTGWRTSPLVVAVAVPGRSATGDRDPLLDPLLDAWSGRGGTRQLPATRVRGGPRPRESVGAEGLYLLGVGCPAMGREDPRYRAGALLAAHLSAVDGPLSRRLRRESAATYHVLGRLNPERGTGWLSLVALVRGAPHLDPVRVMEEELARVRDAPLGRARLAALRSRQLVRITRSTSDNRGRCADATSGVLYGLRPDHQLDIVQGILSTTLEDVAVAAQGLDLAHLAVVVEPSR